MAINIKISLKFKNAYCLIMLTGIHLRVQAYKGAFVLRKLLSLRPYKKF
jgi:hypothetical protein